MEYLNLDLRVTRQPDDRYEVAIIKSPAGEHYATVDLPLSDAEFNESCRQLSLRRRGAVHQADKESASRGLGYGDAAPPDLTPAEVATSIGQHLFESIFSGEMLSCYRRACDAAADENKGLRLRLRLNSPELATIPWEFLFDQYSAEYVSLSRLTPVSRYLEIADRNRTLTVKPPLRILGVVASPTDLPTLNVDREKENMEKSVHHLLEEGLIELTWLEDQSIRGLHSAVANDTWHVLHFIGHGGFDENSEEGFLALCGRDGTCDRLHATELANLLSGPDAIRLAVLNCCEGAREVRASSIPASGPF